MMFIGLDLGTSSLKAILVTDEQKVLAEYSVPITVTRPRDGWSEQDPQEFVKATHTAMNGLAANADLSGVKGIGLPFVS
jgi:xylulokinase